MFRRRVAVSFVFSRHAIILALSIMTLLFSAPSVKSDILFQNKQTGRLVNWLMNGTSLVNFSFLTDPTTPIWKVVGSADFNGDGKPDLLFQNQLTGQLIYWLMDGSTFIKWGYINPSIPGPLDWKVVAVGDFTGDHNPDILFQNQATGQLVYWAMKGTDLVNYGFLPDPGSPSWKVVGAADFDGDGSPDLLFQNQQTGQLVYWIIHGTVFVKYGFLPDPGSPDWKVVGISDFNGDLKADLLFQNQQSGQLVYWLMNGTTLGNIGFINPRNPGSLNWQVPTVWPVHTPVLVDDFNDNSINTQLWNVALAGFGPSIAETNQRLEVDIPATSSGLPVFTAAYQSKFKLKGDFDLQVDYQLLTWPQNNGIRVGIQISDAVLSNLASVHRISQAGTVPGGESHSATLGHLGADETFARSATTATSGKLRIARTGGVFTNYYWDADVNQWVSLLVGGSSNNDVTVSLAAWSSDTEFQHNAGKVAFDNFIVNTGTIIP